MRDPCSRCGQPGYRKGLCRDHFLSAHRGPRGAYRRSGESTSRLPNMVAPSQRAIVYAWFAADGSAEYVGRGFGRRPHDQRYSSWWTPDHILLTMTCQIEWEAMMKEGEWIGRYLPRHNIEGYRHAVPGAAKRRNSAGTAR